MLFPVVEPWCLNKTLAFLTGVDFVFSLAWWTKASSLFCLPVLPVLFNVYHYSVFLLASCLIQWARVRQSLEGLCVYCLCLRNTLKKHSGLSIYQMIISVQEQNQTKVLSRDGFYNTFSYTFPCVDATLKNVERAKATVYRDFCTSYWKSASVLFWNMYILIW